MKTDNAYLAHLINACPDIIMILETDGRIAEANQAACLHLGYEQSALTGTTFPNLTDHPKTRFWLHLPQTGDLVLPLQRLRTASGQWRPVSLKASLLPGARGQKNDILVIGKILHMGSILEFLRLALAASPDIPEQAVLRECLLLCTQGLPDNAPRASPAKVRLTRRERAVLPLVARGFTSREIGEALGILEPTVNKHRENLRRKFDVHNTVDLVQAAKKARFI